MSLENQSDSPKNRTPAYLVTGIGFAIVGGGFWLWSVVTEGPVPVLAVSFVIVGVAFAVIGAIVGRDRRL